MQPLPPPLPVPEKNWWDRNWKWVTALLLALTVAFSVGMVGLLQGFLRGSPAYQEALARARRSPAVVAALGTPIESGLFVMGKVQTTGVKTTSDLAGRLHGPKGEAALVVSGTHSVGGLQLHVFVQIDKSGERIDLSDSPASK